MKIEDFLRRSLRRRRLAIPVTATVSALDSFDWSDHSFIYLSLSVIGTGDTGGEQIEPGEASRGMCRSTVVLTPSYRVPAAKRARKGTLLGGANEAAEKFGPLKVVLGAIPAVFANRKVRRYSLV